MRAKRKVVAIDKDRIRVALAELREALEWSKLCGAKRTADKVRRAIKSAEGAQRHILRLKREQERGE